MTRAGQGFVDNAEIRETLARARLTENDLVLPLPERTTFKPRPFTGVYLEVASMLDAALPGFLNSCLYGSDLLRQVRFFAFAVLHNGDAEAIVARMAEACEIARGPALDTHARIARAITCLKPPKIIEAVTGAPVPTGLIGLLRRAGPSPLSPDPEVYRIVSDLFGDRRNRRRAAVLRQMGGRIDATKIRVVASLDGLLLRPQVILRLSDVRDVEGVHRFLSLVRAQCEASDVDVAASLDNLEPGRPGSGLHSWARSWARRQVRSTVPSPISADDPDLTLRFGAALEDLGRRFRNCAGKRLGLAFLGEHLYAEFVRWPGPGAVLELHPVQTSGGLKWLCQDVRSFRNSDPAPETEAAIRARLRELGIMYRARPGGQAHKTLVSLLDPWGVVDFPNELDHEQEETLPEAIERSLTELGHEVEGALA